jgi:hypothetical protein
MTEIDVDHQINAVKRTLGTRTIDTGEARVIAISQSCDTDQEDLWDVVTDIERIRRWFLPISGDLTAGGAYQLEGQAGGTILTCDPPNNFNRHLGVGGKCELADRCLKAYLGEELN